MWYLRIDTLLLMLGISIASGIALRIAGNRKKLILKAMPVISLGVLLYVSAELMAFYLAYTIFTWVLLVIMQRIQDKKPWFFALSCLLSFAPLCLVRFTGMLGVCDIGFMTVGIAYNMLKAIDALYYVYYSGEKIGANDYFNYILFFPVLTAGPVFRYREFIRTWSDPADLDADRLKECVKRIIRGLFKKMAAAKVVSALLAWMLSQTIGPFYSLIIPVISLLVLYLDMSGYADAAIGMGGLMGFTVPENFKKPLKSPSFTIFWRNWHVTVSDWIREHTFILFQKKKLNKWQGALVSFLVMVLMGIWHGFSWMYLIDGCLLGLILALENILGITTFNRRKEPEWKFVLRCTAVIYLFAINSMIFNLSPDDILRVAAGLVSF